jgi:hypothetical protein
MTKRGVPVVGRLAPLGGAALLVLLSLAPPLAAQTRALPSVELTDPAGDVTTFNGPENARDVVKLSLASDGKEILVAATLAKEEHGSSAGAVVDLYVDTDGNKATGGKDDYEARTGFDYLASLVVCVEYPQGQKFCRGGMSGTPKLRESAVEVRRFKGHAGDDMGARTLDVVASAMDATKLPIEGRVVRGTIPYASLGLKPGQVVRITAAETSARSSDALFPDVLLSLK